MAVGVAVGVGVGVGVAAVTVSVPRMSACPPTVHTYVYSPGVSKLYVVAPPGEWYSGPKTVPDAPNT